MNVADYLIAYLAGLGVRHVFGVGGANIEDVYDALGRVEPQGRIRGILAKHEFSAATMADGYARVGQRLGVCMATSGGGALNLVPGLAEAHASRIPVLALVGQGPRALEGRGMFQDGSGRAGSLDATALFGTVSRFCRRVESAEELPSLLRDAVAAALGRTPGPAVLLIPKDVQQEVIPHPEPFVFPLGSACLAGPGVSPDETLDGGIELVRRLLVAARGHGGVFIVAGDGVARHDAREELAALAGRLDAEVGVAPDARDVFDNHSPRFAGVVGVMGHPSAARRLGEAGAVLLVGTRLPQVARAGLDVRLRGKPVVSVHFEPSFVDDAPLELIGAIGPILRELGRGIVARGGARAPSPREYLPEVFLPGAERRAMSFRQALSTLAPHLPAGANLFVDAGNTGASAVHHLDTPRGGRHVVALGMGGMGYTFGAGIGAAFANGRRTFVLAGDGSFFMHGLEIHTAVQHALPVTFVVFNNDAHGMCHTRERLYYAGRPHGNRYRPSDLAGGVAAMVPSLRVHHARHVLGLAEALRSERGRSGPSFFCVDVDPAEVPPFSPFLEALERAPESRGRHEDRSRKAG